AVISDEVGGSEVDGTYLASYTPLDPNSFLANITVQYPYTPPGGTAGTCSLTTETAYIRSSAD
ncbi:MAG TPA: hypothetical protein VKQ70_02435, partial [Caulobacteraceae bacterium]|nr:hypothetical protein [Caulobacteraceae bacterium]